MDAMTINEFEKLFRDQKFKYLRATDREGDVLVPWNTGRIKAHERLKQIKKRMDTQPGKLVIINAKSSISSKVKPDSFYVCKDIKSVQTLSESPQTIEIKHVEEKKETSESTNVRSYEYVLDLEKRCNRLEIEKESLLEKIEMLEEKLESGPDEDVQTLGERAAAWFNSTMETASPLIDKFLEQRDKKLEIEKMRLYLAGQQGNGYIQQPPQQQQPEDAGANFIIERIETFIQSHDEESPEESEQMRQIYNSAEDLNDFYSKVQNWNEDKFNELVNFINGRDD